MSFDRGAEEKLQALARWLGGSGNVPLAFTNELSAHITSALALIRKLEARVNAFDDAGLLCTAENIHGSTCILPGKHATHFDGALYWKG